MKKNIIILVFIVLLIAVIATFIIQQDQINNLEGKINEYDVEKVQIQKTQSDDTSPSSQESSELNKLKREVEYLETKQTYWLEYLKDFEIRLAEDGVSKSQILPYEESKLAEMIGSNNVHVGDRWPNDLMATRIYDGAVRQAIGKAKITGSYKKYLSLEETRERYGDEESFPKDFDIYLAGSTCITANQDLPYSNEFCLLDTDQDKLTKEEGWVELYVTKLYIPIEGPIIAEVTDIVEK